MGRAVVVLLIVFWSGLAAEPTLELRGRIDPPPRHAVVEIFSARTAFSARTVSWQGRFRFQKLAPGPYVVSVAVPRRGEVRKTLEVSPSFADKKGRVAVTIPFHPPASSAAEALERGNTVSLRELTIPDRAWKEYAAAQKKLGENDAAGAVRHLQRAVELAPQFSAAWNNLGTIAYQSRKYAEAERNFREAMKQDSTAFEPVVNLGGVLLNLGKYKEALEYNLQSVQDRPDDALANAQLGINYFYLGNGDEALKYLRIAKRLDPSHFSYPQLVMAEIYLRRSDRARAIKEFEDFLARHPDAPNAASVRERIERLKR